MTTYACPKGHASETDDFCDTCGAKIDGTTALAAPVLSPASASASADVAEPPAVACPHCGQPSGGAGRFCENCGFDHSTGRVPVLGPAVAAAAAPWSVTAAPNRAYFDLNAIEGVEFPEETAQRTYLLSPPQVRIGRKSSSKGTDPEIDLSAAPLDPGVSHSHALLTLNIDGVWMVSDLGSTNGTYVNDDARPLTAGESRPLTGGDRVHVGAWTTITLHAP